MDYAWGANGLDAIITQVILGSLQMFKQKLFLVSYTNCIIQDNVEFHTLDVYMLLYKCDK